MFEEDIFVEGKDVELFLFDIKTAKPNEDGFKEFNRTLLEWVAAVLANTPDARDNSLIAIPCNPYAPEFYNRWTMRDMLYLLNELYVAEEFWNFLCGAGAYNDCSTFSSASALNCTRRLAAQNKIMKINFPRGRAARY